MFPNKQSFSSGSKVFFEFPYAGLNALMRNVQHAGEKMAELNTCAVRALTLESQQAAQNLLLLDSAQAWVTLVAAQAQANVVKANSYSRHLRNILSVMRDDIAQPTPMKIAPQKLPILADHAKKKWPAAEVVLLARPLVASPVLAVPRLQLLASDVTEASDVIGASAVTEVVKAAKVVVVVDVSGRQGGEIQA